MMKRGTLNCVLLCAVSAACFCEQSPPKYVIGVDIIGPNSSCPTGPVFIGSVRKISPAASVGVKAGDQLVAIDGTPVKDLRDATQRVTSDSPQSVVLDLKRGELKEKVTVQREESGHVLLQNGLRILDGGLLVGSDYTDAEIGEIRTVNRDLMHAMNSGGAHEVFNVFPGHYPADQRLYYPGFEVFVWEKGNQVRVGGIENGPAKQSGMRWGDRILSVNGVDPRKKTLAELESLLSSPIPVRMEITVERAGARRRFSFQLAMAAAVLRDNNWQIVDGQMVPLWVPKSYASCFK
jgi:predicted metalloprotease with PDZ domain